jgi:catechol 2,3-dioxygenase-like lactoylglutathione lyase family enzyme
MRIKLASVFVDDQDKALSFYTEVVGFEKKQDIPIDGARWLTLVSREDPGGTELVLEPDGNPVLDGAVVRLKTALVEHSIPFTAFEVDDIEVEHARMRGLGVRFVLPPTSAGPVTQAVFDDTCGNLIMMYQVD